MKTLHFVSKKTSEINIIMSDINLSYNIQVNP